MHNWKSDMSICIITIKEGAAFLLSICSPDTPYIHNKDIYCSITCLRLLLLLLFFLLFLFINDDRLYSLTHWIFTLFSDLSSSSFVSLHKQTKRKDSHICHVYGSLLVYWDHQQGTNRFLYHSFSERLRTKSSVSN